MNPKELPIYELENALLAELARGRRVVLHAPTGSGKSTQVPQMLLDRGLLGDGQVIILQPRRLATRLLAARVAQERQVKLGGEVGYQIRFDDVSSAATRIKFVTEGILLRRMRTDPRLKGVTAILFDEFHERHLYGDITLARALDLQETVRPDLKLVVMSATLPADLLEKYLDPCAVLSSEGRTHPVAVEYLSRRFDPEAEAVWELAARELERLLRVKTEGDVLVFMPGAFEISRTIQTVRGGQDLVVLPLHGELPPAEQDAAVARYERRKVIVSTNVAETSLTIDGVTLVIDCGLARVARYDPHRGINTLLIEKISRASADQRAGRAGRTAPGHCLRLWTEREHADRPPHDLPEVKRLDLAEVVLTLKASGVEDVRKFRWLEPPEPRSLERAEQLLADLGALDGPAGPITEVGRRMLSFPVHPRYSRMFLAAAERRCVRPVALIAALTQGRNPLLRSEGKRMDEEREDALGPGEQSDFFRLMRAWRYADQCGYDFGRCKRLGIHVTTARQVRPLFDHFLRIAGEEGLPTNETPPSDEALCRCLLAGFSDQLARRCDTGSLRCELVHRRRGVLARESVVQKAPMFVAAEINEIEGRDRDLTVRLSLATAVEMEWLKELFPGDFVEREQTLFDPTQRRVMVERQRLFRDLVLESRRSDSPPGEAASAALAEEVLAGRCPLKAWDEAVEQWILRVNRLAEWGPELGLSAVGPDDRRFMIEQVCHGAVSYKEIKEKSVWPVVKSWLSKPQQDLVEQYAPERLELPGGKKAKVIYAEQGPPTVAARIQDLYGVREGLWIAERRVPVVIQVLAPNFRPIQVTQNLAIFWRETYPKIKQELQRKYPKHKWR